ncbi:MAG: ParM/StbA family protein [Candidatus Heimdallarchaeota archaeon]|nr:ParM/StbA family protein [Candidatus Heimdallarchaeota archaeon]MCK4612038.1 ParM/StbA family protein [Candidatus Heimdallarchaeota archaeon]
MPIAPMTNAVGIDLGTSTIKLTSGDNKYRIPSVIGTPNPGWQGMSSDKSWLNNLIIEDAKGQEVYIGELARLQSEIRKPLASEGKMKSIQNSLLALKAILSLIMKSSYEQFVVATGVPIATGVNESKELSRGLKGTHEIKVRNDATGESKQMKILIEQVFIAPEPYGTYWHTLKTSGVQTAVDSIIVDVGHGTTDILCMYKGNMMRAASGTLEEAVDSLTSALSRAIQEKAGKIIRPFDLMTAIEQGKKNILVGGKALDITSAMDQAVTSIADVIVDESNRLLNNLPPDAWIEKVIVCGGGAYVFGDYLKQAFFEANIVKNTNEVLQPTDAVMSNALGFEQIALTKLKK